jgi:hypothetical protein
MHGVLISLSVMIGGDGPMGTPLFGGGLQRDRGRVGVWVGRLPEINCEFFQDVPSRRGGVGL